MGEKLQVKKKKVIYLLFQTSGFYSKQYIHGIKVIMSSIKSSKYKIANYQ